MEQIKLTETENDLLTGIKKYSKITEKGTVFDVAFNFLQKKLADEDHYINWPYLMKAKKRLIDLEILKPLSGSNGTKAGIYKVNLDKEILVVEKKDGRHKPRKDSQSGAEAPPDILPEGQPGDVFSAIKQQIAFHKRQLAQKEEESGNLKRELELLEKALATLPEVISIISREH